ncbi:MAG TPA: inorganic diphosphatase [Burkholderiales bacterium]|nr:inorganic diphosphatase [Burkholderiales bacterium]
MENILARLEAREKRTGLAHVIIDTPRGSRNKFKYDEELGCFRLSRILPAGLAFPCDFGSIPKTRAEDGDALDVLVLAEAPSFPGCLITVRLIGAITARQSEKGKTVRNDRLIGVPQTPANPARYRDLREVHRDTLDEIEQFFVAYNAAQGRRFVPAGRVGHARAAQLLDAALARHAKNEGSGQ